MKLLQLPITTINVQRTGLPFYDAARVIGVAQLFFGTSNAVLKETGFGWTLSGTTSQKELEANRLWICGRLRSFEPPPSANYNRVESWFSNQNDPTRIQTWREFCAYFGNPLTVGKVTKKNTTGMMDAALALGSRGYDVGGYRDLAAESGTPSQQAEAETLAALFGLSHAARVNNSLFLLPVFGDVEGDGKTVPITTARYWNYNRIFIHEGGEKIAVTWAMLSMLETLFDQGLPIIDFAYNRAARPIYHSGTLAAEKLCRCWRDGYDNTLREIRRYLELTPREKGGHRAALARALADFALNPDAVRLERIIRLKARAMANEDKSAMSLLRQPETLEEINNMVKTGNGEIPDLPESLVRAVQQALNLTKDNKSWIGGYMKLENANTPHRFVEEAQRLVSRARIERSIYYVADAGEKTLPDLISELALSPQKYRAFRAAFLLRVLQNIRTPKPTLEDDLVQENNDQEDIPQ
jgi:hypothetical protein